MSLEHAFFYKSVNGDRVYDDSSFEHWLKKFFTSGVFLNDLQVSANDDMSVTVGGGYVNIDGKVKIFESATPLIIETAGASYPRIDSIVLERNDSERDILLKVVKGGYSSEPVAHTPVRQDGVYQLVIAQVLVNAGAVKVTQANITDTRSNTELCGIVAGAVDQIDFSQIQKQFDSYFAQYKAQIAADYTEYKAQIAEDYAEYNADMEANLDQMEADFAAWFENVRNQLDEDAAGHLQNQIDDIKAEMELLGGSMVEVTVEACEYNVEGLEVNLVIDEKTYTETIHDNVVKFTGVLEVGTAKITCVDEAQEINTETSINIPCYSAYETSIKLSSGGSYKEWLEAGGLNPSAYESLDVLLEDEKAVRTLMTKKDAVDVLARMSGDDLATIINHRYAAKWVNYREYAYSTLSAVSEIKTIMDASGMYGMYITVESDGTWQPKGLVPVMTSNTAPYGEASASSENSSDNGAYCAFNNVSDVNNDAWVTKTGVAVAGSWLSYKFVTPTNVKRFKLTNRLTGGDVKSVKNFKLQATNGNNVWVDLGVYTNESDKKGFEAYYDVINDAYYMQYRVFVDSGYSTENVAIGELQFYGRQLEALVPPMTSNTAPIGECSAVNEGTEYHAYNAFNGDLSICYATHSNTTTSDFYLKYDFGGERDVRFAKISAFSTDENYKYFVILQGSNNNSKWEKIGDGFEVACKNVTGFVVDASSHNIKYRYYRLILDPTKCSHPYTRVSGSYALLIANVELYGTPDYDSRTYIYEHGVEVMGVSADGYTYSGYTVEEATKTEDSIIVKPSASSGKMCVIGTNNTIDLSAYSCIFVKAIDWLLASNVAGYIITNVSKVAHDSTSHVDITTNNNCLDINNINASSYICIRTAGDRMIEVAEWWLE